MKPIGALMWEHRLIEQIIPLIATEIRNIRGNRKVDVVFIEHAVDFFRTYADRVHHGKEENILFAELAKKPLSENLTRILKELTDEHVMARKTVLALFEAGREYRNGHEDRLETIISGLTDLINLYPGHIEKEDKHFFFPAMDCFTLQEQDRMLEAFWEFDRKMIHEKYQNIMEQMGGTVKRW